MKRSRAYGSAILVGVLLSGCASTGYFKEASSNEPHGVLQFSTSVAATFFAVQEVTPLELDGKPPNEWTKLNFKRFIASPGEIRLLLQGKASSGLIAICSLRLTVKAGQVYSFQVLNGDETLEIKALDSVGSEVASCEGGKGPAPRNTSTPVFIPT